MNYFIDCGYYVGKAIEYYAPFLKENWRIYAFEPNQELNVTETSQRFIDQGIDFVWEKKAVWTEDTTVDFWISKLNNASYVAGVSKNAPFKKIAVNAVDFSKYVEKKRRDQRESGHGGEIAISMDIEGAEYPVLRKMIADKTMNYVSLIDIEFHHRLLKDEDAESTSNLIREVQSCGTLVKLKVPVND